MNRRTAVCMVLVLVFAMGGAAHAFAQFGFDIQREQSNVYVKSLQIEEVYASRYGYRVLFRRSSGRLGYANLPMEWFGAAAGRGSVVYSHSAAVPYMNVVFVDGEETNVDLYLPPNRRHQVYRYLDPTENWEDRFAGIEALNIDY